MSEPRDRADVCDRVRRALERTRAAKNPGLFALFECRGQLVAGTPVLDGGVRAEPADGEAGRSVFAVGAGPSALDPLLENRKPRDWSRGEWDEAARVVSAALVAAGERVATHARALADDLARVGAVGVDVGTGAFARLRGWSDGAGATHGEMVASGVARVAWSTAAGPGDATLLFPFDGAPAPVEIDAATLVRRTPLVRIVARAHRLARLSRTGPLVLAAPASAWLAHELAHAALEGLVATAPPFALHDDPAAAPWPAGFARDDRGHAAARCVLAPGVAGARARAARRRASIREAARPALSCTALEPPSSVPLPERDGCVYASRCSAGRVDPVARAIVLVLDDAAVREAGRWAAVGSAIAVIELDQGWPRIERILGAEGSIPLIARCSRAGSLLRVMVGAPTLMLTPCQVWPREVRAAAGGERDEGA